MSLVPLMALGKNVRKLALKEIANDVLATFYDCLEGMRDLTSGLSLYDKLARKGGRTDRGIGD
jgi:hypothetical protein